MSNNHIIEYNKSLRKPEGWICVTCHQKFETRAVLLEHRRQEHKVGRNCSKNNIWQCKYCNTVFKTRKLLYEHNKECSNRKNQPIDSLGRVIPSYDRRKAAEKMVETKREKGNISHPVSMEDRVKKAKAMIEYKKSLGISIKANFSKRACDYIDNLNKEKGWNLQHGLNGGEKQVGPYFLDGYDEKRNIAFEYDEIAHHRNKKVEERDIVRQRYIIKILNCKFWRYDEKYDKLYQVN